MATMRSRVLPLTLLGLLAACREAPVPEAGERLADGSTADQSGPPAEESGPPADERRAPTGESGRSTDATAPGPAEPVASSLLEPPAAALRAPEVFDARFETTAGAFVVRVHRAWAPHAADRFHDLVQRGYFRDVRIHRVVPGFVVQFGLHGDPAVTAAWEAAVLPPDPAATSNEAGRVAFAMAGGPETRSIEVFVNLVDNPNLDRLGFAPFGEVVEGMEVVRGFHAGHGEVAPRGPGPDPRRLRAEGNAYLRERFPRLDVIRSASVLR